MARMHRMLGSVALGLMLVAASAGCQWPGLTGPSPVTQTPSQTSAAPADAPEAPPANPPSPAKPAPTTNLSSSPQVAAVQQEVQEFVNRFPDSDLSRKVAESTGPGDPAPVKPTSVTAQRPVTDASGKPVKAPGAVSASDSTARQASGLPPAVPAVAESGAQTTKTIQQNSAAPDAGASANPSAESAVIRANSPIASERVVRAGSFSGADAAPSTPKVEAIEIAPLPAPGPAEATPPKAEPNRAATAVPTPKVRDIDATIAELQQIIAERPSDSAALFRLRMLYFAEGLDDKATAPVAGLDPEIGDVFADLTRTLVAVRDATRDPLNRSSSAIDQTRQLAQRLRRQAPVSIDKIALVSRVNSYGDYEEVSPAEFPAGQATRLILYAEVSNFRSEKGEADRYRTLLGETVEVFDTKGQSVFKQVHDKIPDTCRRVRNDFFLALELALPETLAPGAYTVKATVEDKLSATADQAQVTFTIAAPKR